MVSMHNRDDRGLVSIMVVTLVIIILSLMTIGFARIMDRGLRESTDRELATQASYAAEAGLNDARAYVTAAAKTNTNVSTNGNCLDLGNPPAPFLKNGTLSGNYNGDSTNDTLVRYTCVIIDPKPNDLVYDLHAGESKLFKIYTDSGKELDKLFFSWTNATGSHAPLSTTSARPLPQENDYVSNGDLTGVLRTSIYPIPNSAGSSGDTNSLLADKARTYFMYPNGSNAAPGTVSYTQNGRIVSGNCNDTNLTSVPDPLPFKQAKPHYCNTQVGDLVEDAVPPPPPDRANRVTVSGWVEGPNGQGFPNIAVTLYAREGATTRNLGTTTFDPDTFADHKGLICAGALAAGPPQSRQTFTISRPIPGIFNNPEISVEFSGDGWDASTNYDNNVRVDDVTIRYGATSVSASPLTGSRPSQMCTDSTIDWSAEQPTTQGTPATPVGAFYYVRITALYRDLSVSIQGADVDGNSLDLLGAETIIDVTGQGNDVLKRLKGRVTQDLAYDIPDFGIQSMDTLCKRLRLPKTGANSYGSSVLDDSTTLGANPDGACRS